VQPSHEVPASWGMWRVTRSAGERTPSATSDPHAAEVTDFDTDISRCVVSGRIPFK
jgi:hypothetical protein